MTEAGRAAFADWLAQEPGPETIRHPLLLTVAFGRHLPADQLAAFLSAHREVHASRLAHYEHRRADTTDTPDPYALATLEFGIAYERAILAWFDHLPPDLPANRQ